MAPNLAWLWFNLFLWACQASISWANSSEPNDKAVISWLSCQAYRANNVECTSFKIPLDYEQPVSKSGNQLNIEIVRASSESGLQKYPPLLFIAGGPGQSATEVFPYVLRNYQKLRKHRDIYAISMRGSRGAGELHCKAEEEAQEKGELFFTQEQHLDMVKRCVAERKYDPLLYNTQNHVRDLETIRQKLGLGKWDLHGISYGTRVVLEYLRLFPQSVNRSVLEGVAGFGHPIGDEIQKVSSQQIERIAKECLTQADCRDSIGDSAEMVSNLLQKTKDGVHSINLDVFGTKRTYQFNQDDVVGAIYSHLYQPEAWSALPLRIQRALLLDDYSGLFSMLSAYDSVNTSLYWSVVCQEDVPFYKALDPSETVLFPDRRDQFIEVCDQWFGEDQSNKIEQEIQQGRGSQVHKPFRSEHPILLLSGEFDPVAPPFYSQSILKNFPNAKQFIFKGQGHNISHLPCGQKIVRNFLQNDENWQNETCNTTMFSWPYFSSSAGFRLDTKKIDKLK